MKNNSNKLKKFIDSFSILSIVLLTLSGCTFAQSAIAALRSTDHFVQYQNDKRILFEPGAEDYARKIADSLPVAISQVEFEHLRPFSKPVQVYICASQDNFIKFAGQDASAKVLTKLFLSPRVFEKGDDIADLYLAHELSHLHLLQNLGFYKMSRLPFSFKEGLATFASDGGGAYLISEQEASESIRTGRHFIPNKAGGFIFQKTPSDFGLQPQMFYRQSMLFVEYLASHESSQFKEMIVSIYNGENFVSSIHNSYGKSINELWSEFIKNIKKMG